jgi:hypothetical protein
MTRWLPIATASRHHHFCLPTERLQVEKREPDFLICYRGKWGILEINGDDFHSGPIQTAKDHDRARRFNHYGVFFIQAYPLDRCKNRPGDVVDEFLHLLERHK